MKNYRKLVPLVLVVLLASSWYMLISESNEADNTYKNYLTEARKYAEDGITKYAMANYNAALEIKSDVDVYVEVAKYYKSQKNYGSHLDWCENFFEIFPTEPKAYDCLLEAYLIQEDYESCYDVLITAQKRNISTDYIKSTTDEIKYVYKLAYNRYEDVSMFSGGLCAVQNKGAWGFVDRYGEQQIACKYAQVGAFTQSNFAPVVNLAGDTYFIDKTGAKVLVSKEKYSNFGLLINNTIAAQREDGKFVYVNKDFSVLFGEYDYASTMNNGIAAVRIGEQWQLINEKGERINEANYFDVKLDEKQIACRSGRAFVAIAPDKYIMVDASGNQVGNLQFTDAKVFASSNPTAVKINNEWCFVDLDGKLVSDKKYQNANSYANGMAAVCIKGKWGFVDEKENIVIEPRFNAVKDFNELGSCFVKVDDDWQLLKMYRLNRKG